MKSIMPFFFEKHNDVLVIGRIPDDALVQKMAPFPGEYPLWDGWVLTASASAEKIESILQNKDAQRVWIDGEKLHAPLTMRIAATGDRFHPLKLSGSQSLADFFINQKIPRYQRRRIPLFCCGDQIVWVCGYRLDDRFKVAPHSKLIYELRLARQREF